MTTPREQLTQLVSEHHTIHDGYKCGCGWEPPYGLRDDEKFQEVFQHIADMTIQAGWTPPPTPATPTFLDN